MQHDLSPMYRCKDGNVVQFYEMAVPNTVMSEREGRKVMWKALMARVMSPGMKNQVHEQELELRDESGKQVRRSRSAVRRDKTILYWDEVFAEQLRAWRESRVGVDALGTPLEQYPKIDVAQAAMLRASGIHTLEQLGAVPDSQLDGLGPQARVLRDGALAFTSSLEGNSELRKQVAILQAQIDAMKNGQNERPRRGRKPKAEAHAEAA